PAELNAHPLRLPSQQIVFYFIIIFLSTVFLFFLNINSDRPALSYDPEAPRRPACVLFFFQSVSQLYAMSVLSAASDVSEVSSAVSAATSSTVSILSSEDLLRTVTVSALPSSSRVIFTISPTLISSKETASVIEGSTVSTSTSVTAEDAVLSAVSAVLSEEASTSAEASVPLSLSVLSVSVADSSLPVSADA